MFSLFNRFKKPWRTTYLEEVAEELEVLRRNLVELQHLTRVVQGKIAAFEETAKSQILRPEEGHQMGVPEDFAKIEASLTSHE